MEITTNPALFDGSLDPEQSLYVDGVFSEPSGAT